MEKWNEGEIVRFLDYFEARPCLWNPDVPEYRSPDKRSEAIRWIIQKLGIRITEMEIRCKIKNIRSSYLKYLKRVLRAKEVGLGEEYLPTLLWYNKADAFMREHTMRAMNKKEQKRNQQCTRHSGRCENPPSRFDQDLPDSDCEAEAATAEFEDEDDNDESSATATTNNGSRNNDETIKNSTDLSSQKNDAMEASESDDDRFEFQKSNYSTQLSSRNQLHSNRSEFQDGGSNVDHGSSGSRVQHSTEPTRKRTGHSFCQDGEDGDEFDTFSRHVGNQLRQLPLERALRCQDAIHSLLMRERIESCQESSSTRMGSSNTCAAGPPMMVPQKEPSTTQDHHVVQMDSFSYALKCMED